MYPQSPLAYEHPPSFAPEKENGKKLMKQEKPERQSRKKGK
jgi:hypothetical protein